MDMESCLMGFCVAEILPFVLFLQHIKAIITAEEVSID